MFSIRRDFIHFENRIVEVIRSFIEEHVKDVEGLKKYLQADTVLRKDNRLYFCVSVTEVEFEEIPNE